MVAACKDAQESEGYKLGTNAHAQTIKLEFVLYTPSQKAQGPLHSHPNLSDPGAHDTSTGSPCQRVFHVPLPTHPSHPNVIAQCPRVEAKGVSPKETTQS